MDDLFLVVQGTSSFYCTKDQVDIWDKQGAEIYALSTVAVNAAAKDAEPSSAIENIGIGVASTPVIAEPEVKQID